MFILYANQGNSQVSQGIFQTADEAITEATRLQQEENDDPEWGLHGGFVSGYNPQMIFYTVYDEDTGNIIFNANRSR